MIEAIHLIDASNLSRGQLAKCDQNPYTLGLIENCRYAGKPLCVNRHNHCVLTSRCDDHINNSAFIINP